MKTILLNLSILRILKWCSRTGHRVTAQDINRTIYAFDRTQWFYDDATGLLTNKLYADGKGTSYSYTGDGKLQTRIWARDIGRWGQTEKIENSHSAGVDEQDESL